MSSAGNRRRRRDRSGAHLREITRHPPGRELPFDGGTAARSEFRGETRRHQQLLDCDRERWCIVRRREHATAGGANQFGKCRVVGLDDRHPAGQCLKLKQPERFAIDRGNTQHTQRLVLEKDRMATGPDCFIG